MKIHQIFAQKKKVISFEIFAPKRDGNLEKLFQTVDELKGLNPDYISITYGAGGTSRDMTFEIAVRLKSTGILPLMHFTCLDHSREEIKTILDRVKEAGIENLLALRGDPPKGQTTFVPPRDGFRYASELIQFIRSHAYDFSLGVAGYPEGHPEAGGLDRDLLNLKRKVEVGGQFIVTQLFFENQDYFEYVKRTRAMGIQAPIQPGIWLLTDFAQIEKTGSLGARIPSRLVEELKPFKDDKEKVIQKGIDYATRQCEELLKNGAPGIHFYAMNKSHSVKAVMGNLRDKGLLDH